MDNLHKNIKKFRKEAKLTQKELGDKIGVTASAVTQFEAEPSPDKREIRPSLETLYEIADATGKSIIDFFPNSDFNKKQIVKKELKSNLMSYTDYIPENIQLKDIVLVKKLDILAGAGAEGIIDIELLESGGVVPVERRILGHLNPSNVRAIEVIGDSMYPKYDEGDIALIDMVNHRYDFVKIEGIYIVRVNDVVYIKRVVFDRNGGLKLISINKEYGDIDIRADENYEILGKVCGKVHYEVYKGLTFDDQGIK